MGNFSGVKSSPAKNELNPVEQKAHDEINRQMVTASKKENQLKKLLLLGTAASGKSTLCRQLQYVYKWGFTDQDCDEVVPIIRKNCVSGILTLLRKTQELYEMDEKEYESNYININDISQELLNAIKTVASIQKDTFQDYENSFASYGNMIEIDDNYIDDDIEIQIQAKRDELSKISKSLSIIWNLTEIQSIWEKRFDGYAGFSFPDNMDFFFAKLNEIFSWHYMASDEDIFKCNIPTTCLFHDIYENGHYDQYVYDSSFTVTDIAGQRYAGKKWIDSFQNFNAILFVAALNDYAHVLLDDESKNAMIESIELFDEICNDKRFKESKMILFLNKDDLFREYIMNDIPLSVCFNDNTSIYKQKYHDNDSSYYPQSKYDKNRNQDQNTVSSQAENDIYIHSKYELVIYGYLRNIVKYKNNDYSFIFAVIGSFLKHGYSKCAIYPKPDLRYSAKDLYQNGEWRDESDEKWFDFIYNDYMNWITEQYLCRNLARDVQPVFIHVMTATNSDSVKKTFWNVQNIVFNRSLRHAGIM